MRVLNSIALMVAAGILHDAHAAPCSSPYVKGDVFAAVGNSMVDVFTPAGSLLCTLNDASGTQFTTGMTFDSSGNLYVTNFNAGTVSKFDNSGGLVSSSFMSSTNVPESIVNVGAGIFVGSSLVGGASGPKIEQFNTITGALTHVFTPLGAIGPPGSAPATSFIDLLNNNTVIYDNGGTQIRSYNLATMTQNPDFTSAAAEAALTGLFVLRVINAGPLAGDVLVANSIDVVLLDPMGNIERIYTNLPGNGMSIGLIALDPNGTDFWAGDFVTDQVREINIATGATDNTWNVACGANCTFAGIAVFPGSTPPPPAPEPGSFALLATGLAGLGLARHRQHRAA